ncbi:hypothetical protein DKX38_017913 [Salix brachista]|uniref:Ubiquitin thioesterase OTU n=1 Tax=Salix brachista TaxID=2182728 RepID=A0A5N5KWL3_9ROSI|nr:hypothetical protein DKX38_017913 [Salix brachista]
MSIAGSLVPLEFARSILCGIISELQGLKMVGESSFGTNGTSLAMPLYSQMVWQALLLKAQVHWPTIPWMEAWDWATTEYNSGVQTKMMGLLLGATVYCLWQERNRRFHDQHFGTPQKMIEDITNLIRDKLGTLRERDEMPDSLRSRWNIPLRLGLLWWAGLRRSAFGLFKGPSASLKRAGFHICFLWAFFKLLIKDSFKPSISFSCCVSASGLVLLGGNLGPLKVFGRFLIIDTMEGIVVRRVIPSDNSCLFNAVGYVMDNDKNKAFELRQVPAPHLYFSFAFNMLNLCNSLTCRFSLCGSSVIVACLIEWEPIWITFKELLVNLPSVRTCNRLQWLGIDIAGVTMCYPEVIAGTVASDPEKYNEVFLGKPNGEYCNWIRDSEKWGGAIELSILADYYGREIAAYDIQTMRCDLYGQDRKYSERVMLIYDGLHYDALAMSQFEGAPEEFDQTIFTVLEDRTIGPAEGHVLHLVKDQQRKRSYTDTANFTLRCGVCQIGVIGQKEAVEHAQTTGHVNFQEYR